jgi:hypothetical protein
VYGAQGRTIKVKATHAGVASFDFAELCDRPNSAADFIALARAFHTVILHNIPLLSMDNLPVVRRFITLVDVLYDHQAPSSLLNRHHQPPPPSLPIPRATTLVDASLSRGERRGASTRTKTSEDVTSGDMGDQGEEKDAVVTWRTAGETAGDCSG